MIATAINAAMSPYSIAVTPSSSWAKRLVASMKRTMLKLPTKPHPGRQTKQPSERTATLSPGGQRLLGIPIRRTVRRPGVDATLAANPARCRKKFTKRAAGEGFFHTQGGFFGSKWHMRENPAAVRRKKDTLRSE
jgi:hypothetical protein